MRKLKDLVGDRTLSSGVFEYHCNKVPTQRGKILYIRLDEGNVSFTLTEMTQWENNSWTRVTENSGVNTFTFDKEIPLIGSASIQFDFKGGWVILYPNTDSVRIP